MSAFEPVLDAVDRCLRGDPDTDLESVFDPSFLAHLPLPQLRTLLEQLREGFGDCTGHQVLNQVAPGTASVRWYFSEGSYMDGVIGISEHTPGRVVLLNLGPPTRSDDSWDDLLEALRALPGSVSFGVRDLDADATLASLEPDRRLGVGSTSKLAIFATLLEDVRAGKRDWRDLLEMRADVVSAPSGIMNGFPPGSPVTLHTVALLLILLSDNTAADLLLAELGRDRVEALLERVGTGDAKRDPFPATRELFRLITAGHEYHDHYQRADVDERRRMLTALGERQAPLAQTSEAWPEGIDWNWSAADTLRLLTHLRPLLADETRARAILGTRREGVASEGWSWVGYKGGSSPGRLSLAALLQDPGGRWVGACLIFNTRPEHLDTPAVGTLFKRATDLALRVPAQA